MGFVIPAHGVITLENGLSPMQTQLLQDPHPIRICGAPTGSGKTYAFINAAKSGQWILFVVPTQALARDIQEAATKESIYAPIWDHNQSLEMRNTGKNIWEERKTQVEKLAIQGGFLITTPESLGQLLRGRPQLEKIHLPLRLLLHAKHWVFDEAHTISERGFGFMHFWLSFTAYLHKTYPNEAFPKITLLSATHSNLWQGWFSSEKDSYLSPSWVAHIDESLVTDSDTQLRWLHGNVQVEVEEHSVLELFLEHGLELLQAGQRVLIIYDSLQKMINDQTAIYNGVCSIGLSSNDIFIVDGQDKQVNRSLDSVSHPSGLTPDSEHRLIIGTSAIEMGVNYPNVRCAFLDPGIDAAALLQRIGRVARGNYEGFVWVSTGIRYYSSTHVTRMLPLKGNVEIDTLRSELAPLRTFNLQRAKALGSAYWSWLKLNPGHLGEFLSPAHASLSDTPQPGRQLDGIRASINSYSNFLYKNRLVRWIRALDLELSQLRDFSSTVSVQFGPDNPPIEYSRDWIERNLDCSRTEIRNDEVWYFPAARDRFLLDKPRTVWRYAIHPFLESVRIEIRPGSNPIHQLLAYDTSELFGESLRVWEQIEEFILATGLVTFDQTDDTPGDSRVL